MGDNKAVYIGSGAGAVIASKNLPLYDHLTDDKTTIFSESNPETLGLFEGTIIPHCDEKELEAIKRRLAESDQELLGQYKSVLRVGKDETLMCLWGKKRLN